MRLFHKVRVVLEMIRFSHSVFALPFALMAMLIAAGGWPSGRVIFWVILACFFARSAAMAFNRLADHAIDARNPRTAMRALPRGMLSRQFVWVFTILCVAGFICSAAMPNPLCLALSPLALIILLGYSYTKRFTSLSHLVLGLALGVAPVGAWLAVRGQFDLTPIVLCVGVILWVAGFDIIYSCQDYEHDLRVSLYSIPKLFGLRRALMISKLFHAGAFAAFLAVYFLGNLGVVYLAAALLAGALMIYEHSLVRPDDLSRVNAAFFNVNGIISIGLLLATILDFTISGPR